MKKTIIFISVLLSFLIILLFTIGCWCEYLRIDPDDYYIVDYNIVWTEYKRERWTSVFPSRYTYYEIQNIPTNEYIACRFYDFGENFTMLMKHKNFEGNLELDASSAKFFIGDVGCSHDEWSVYGEKILQKEVAQVDIAIAEKLVNNITADSPQYDDPYELYGSHWTYLYNDEGEVLRLTFSIKEYDELVWQALILKIDELYFIQTNEKIYSNNLLLCSEELASVIDEICEKENLSVRRGSN